MKKGHTDESGEKAPRRWEAALPVRVEEVSDELLIRAITLGVVWALEMLYDRYKRLLYSLAYRMVNDQQVAEELLQDTFVSVWWHASSYNGRLGAVQTWLVAILRHRAISYLRSKRSQVDARTVSLQQMTPAQESVSPDPWEYAWRSLQASQVRKALSMLSTEQRLVLELTYFEGWTQTEIASRYHLPLGTVKARMRLGLLRLRHILEGMGGVLE